MNRFFNILINYTIQQTVVFGIVAGLVYYFTIFDDGSAYVTEIQSIQTNIKREEEKKKETENTLKEAQRMKEAIGTLSQQYQQISRRIPSNLSSIELNRNIDAFARNSGTSIKSRKPMAIVPKEIVDEVPVQISLEGSYADLAQFVYLVSSSERIASVRTFTLKPIERQSTKLRLDGTVVGYQLADENRVDKNNPRNKRPGAK